MGREEILALDKLFFFFQNTPPCWDPWQVPRSRWRILKQKKKFVQSQDLFPEKSNLFPVNLPCAQVPCSLPWQVPRSRWSNLREKRVCPEPSSLPCEPGRWTQ